MKLYFFICIIVGVFAPPPQRAVQTEAPPVQSTQEPVPVNPEVHHQQEQQPEDDGKKNPYELTYSKYLEEVVKILESDEQFRARLKEMPESDIKTGKIADHIDELSPEVFDKLHKVKLDEIENLRTQIEKQIEADKGAHNVKIPEHLDLQQWEKFGKEDLRLLIKKTVADMEEIDKQRREEFKEYEMRKKAEEDHRLAGMNEAERTEAIRLEEEKAKKHNEHEKLKHPASRDQLEEVWEERDQMDKDSFDPRTFFALHDLNGDGFWNAEELEALFNLELEKMYNDTNPEDDPRERVEEMYRMREHVVKQMDKNNDRLISLEEFLQDTEAQTPGEDPGWKDLGQEQVYTDDELQKFEKEYAEKMGWGENAYETTLTPSQAQKQQQTAQPAQSVNHAEPNLGQPVEVHPAQPALHTP